MATPTKQYSYQQGCGVGVPESHVLDQSRSTFFRFDEVGVASRSWFFKFGEVGNRIYGIWRLRFTLSCFTVLQYLFYIYPLDSQECDRGAVNRQAIIFYFYSGYTQSLTKALFFFC